MVVILRPFPFSSAPQLFRYETVMRSDRVVEAAQRHASGEAVCGEQSIEGISRPVERQSVTEDRGEWGVVEDEARVSHECLGESGVVDAQPPHLGEKLDLQQSHGGYTPRPVGVDPAELPESRRIGHEPDEEMCIEQKRHRLFFSMSSTPSSVHVQDQRSAASASGA